MKKFKIIFLLIFSTLSVLGISSCHRNSDKPDPVAEQARRTVLVYMVAANSLGQGQADTLDMIEMKKAATSGLLLPDARWLVFRSTYKRNELLELLPDGEFKTLKSYSSDPAVTTARMEEVISDTKKFAPAADYGLVLWSHATGWIEDGCEDAYDTAVGSLAPMSFGLQGAMKMNITSLRSVLRDSGFDFIYCDCCLMGSIEVAYELRDCARFIVSSPSETPFDGMPYDVNLPLLLDGSRDALVQAARNTFNLYNNKPMPFDRTASMTVIDTDALDRLAAATLEIYKATPLAHPLNDKGYVTNYYGNDYVTQGFYLDFGEYVDALAGTMADSRDAVTEFHNALDAAVIYHDATEKLWDKWPIYNCSGLSTRVFDSVEDFNAKGYDRLEWAQKVVKPRFNQD